MLNDLVYMMRNSLVDTNTLYQHAVKLFDSNVLDITQFFSELSRISAIAKFVRVHDFGTTSAFTDRTFELIAQHKAKCSDDFSITSLLESGFDEAQIQLPGFITVLDYFRPENKSCDITTSDKSETVACSVPEPTIIHQTQVIDDDHLDVATLSLDESIPVDTDKIMHNNLDLSLRENKCGELSSGSCINKHYIQAKKPPGNLIDESIYDPENPNKYSDDYSEIHALRSYVPRSPPRTAVSENGTRYYVNRTENEMAITRHYETLHKPPNDPFQPDDYYCTPDLCNFMMDKHKTKSIYDIGDFVVHLPLKQNSQIVVEIQRLMQTYPLSVIRKVSYVPTKPAVFSSFIKFYETKDFRHALFDCLNIRLIRPQSDSFLASLKFSEQHMKVVYENVKAIIMQKNKIKFVFNFLDFIDFAKKSKFNLNFVAKNSYEYCQLIIITTYHSYTFNKVTVVIYTEYDKLCTRSHTEVIK